VKTSTGNSITVPIYGINSRQLAQHKQKPMQTPMPTITVITILIHEQTIKPWNLSLDKFTPYIGIALSKTNPAFLSQFLRHSI